MGIFRRTTIFHAEESMPDPDDLKLRFRRKVLFLAVVGFLVILGFPVLRNISVPLQLRHETRRFAEVLLDSRLLASKNRTAVSLHLSNNSEFWIRKLHSANAGCSGESFSPAEQWPNSSLQWQFHLQKETGETISGQTLCIHPLHGLALDSAPLGEGKLLVSVKSPQESQELGHLIVSSHGDEIQTVSEMK